MSLDFQQIREQVIRLGENAHARARERQSQREKALSLLRHHAKDLQSLRKKVQEVVRNYDPSLRCAVPLNEELDDHLPLPSLPPRATVLAADGSQIFPSRHDEVEYGLINVGSIQMCYGSPEPPTIKISSRLLYDQELNTDSGRISESLLALRRDIGERRVIAELASNQQSPVITFTDGLMEIWGPRSMDAEELSEFQQSLDEYLEILSTMQKLEVITAGYVDKPGSSLVVRLLEVAMTPEGELADINKKRPLSGVYDIDLYNSTLEPGERSPIYSVQSPSTKVYTGALSLHFFYLNVGREGHPILARVEFPAWVAENHMMLNDLHAILIDQCRTMGSQSYPYLLHRAHETARVTQQDKYQVTHMIALEMRNRGVPIGEKSSKQSAKDLDGRTRYVP